MSRRAGQRARRTFRRHRHAGSVRGRAGAHRAGRHRAPPDRVSARPCRRASSRHRRARPGVDAIVSDRDDGDHRVGGAAVRRVPRLRHARHRRAPGRSLPHRVGAPDVGHDRRAEAGRSHVREPDGADTDRRRTQHRRRVGDVLRHPAIRRTPDLAAGRPRARLVRGVRRRRIDRGLPRAARRARGDARLGDADALASGADERGGSCDRTALHSAVRRNRRPGDPERASTPTIRRPASVMPSPRRKPASDSRSTMVSRAFRRRIVGAPGDVQIKVDDGSLRIRSARTCGSTRRRRTLAPCRRGRLRRHRRHRGTPRRPLLLPRSTQRHHQRRRTEGPSRGSGSGHQPAPGRTHVDGAVQEGVRLSVRSSPPTSCWTQTSDVERRRRGLQARDSSNLSRQPRPPQDSGDDSFRSRPRDSPLPASWPAMRKVIVTGGSRGLGLAIVRRLVCEGYCAIVVARQMNDLLGGVDRGRRAIASGLDPASRRSISRT